MLTEDQITIYRNHSSDCSKKADRYAPKCGCKLWFQYMFDGKQRQHTSGARTWDQARVQRTEMVKKFTAGEVPQDVTIKTASDNWIASRDLRKKNNEKALRMIELLSGWCKDHDIVLLNQITTPKIMEWQLTLPFRTGDSSSLRIHWSVISGFFSWSVGMKYISLSPIPNTRQFPQFKIEFDKPEVVVPSKATVEKSILTAEGKVKLLMLLQRWSGMAIADAVNLRRDSLVGNLLKGNRQKTNERFRVRIPQDLADSLHALTCDSPDHFFHDGEVNHVVCMRHEYTKVFAAAKVKMSSHLFRHYRITELLAAGVRAEDVAVMVGTSPNEIRKTYQHWIKEAEDRLDEVQNTEFLRHGLVENPKPMTVQ